jgi:hypothetical protein
MPNNNGKTVYTTTLIIAGLMALFFTYVLIVSIFGSIKSDMVFWTISKMSVIELIGLSVISSLIPLLILLDITRISYSLANGNRPPTNKIKKAGKFLSVLMICMILVMVSGFFASRAGEEGLGQGMLFELLSLISLLPYITYHNEFRKAKGLIQTNGKV